jgi:HD-like signal output (HDOD) protein
MRRFDEKHPIPAPHTLPDHRVLQALMDMTESCEVDYSKFCEAAIDQPVITTQIMRAARSIRAGRENGVEELRHAIAIIGMRRVHDIIEKTRSHLARVQSVAD